MWRIEVLHAFLTAGIPLRKIDDLRHLFERNNHRLTEHSNLLKPIPVILQEELRLIKTELKQPGTEEGKYVS